MTVSGGVMASGVVNLDDAAMVGGVVRWLVGGIFFVSLSQKCEL